MTWRKYDCFTGIKRESQKIYSRNEAFILPVIKFLTQLYRAEHHKRQNGIYDKDRQHGDRADRIVAVFFPAHRIYGFFAMMFAVLHMYALSIETAAVGLVVFLLLYLLFLRFTAKEALVVVLTPVLCVC